MTKDKDRWKESIPYVSSLITHDSIKIQAKALWLLGEIGLIYPQFMEDAVPTIGSFLGRPEPLLRERAVNALGRIGRGSYPVIETYWMDLFRFASVIPSMVTNALVGPTFASSYGLIQKRWFAKMQFRYLRIREDLFEDYYKDTSKISKYNMIAFLKANTAYEIKPAIKSRHLCLIKQIRYFSLCVV